MQLIISFLPSIEPQFDTWTDCSRNPIPRKEKKRKNRNLGRLKEEEKKAEKLRLFHNNRARTLAEETSWVKFSPHRRLAALRCSGLSLTTLSIRRTNSLAGSSTPMAPLLAPKPWQVPSQVAGQGGILAGKRSKFHGQGATSSTHEGIAADPGWGSGKELDLMGQGGGTGGGREREGRGGEREGRRKCVLVGSCSCFVWTNDCVVFSLLFSSFWGFWMGVVWLCALPLSCFLSPLWGGVACCLPLARWLSLSSEEGNGTTFF